MASNEDPTPMDIDNGVPSPTSSNTSQIPFKDDMENLPSNGPSSHAHIIDLEDYTHTRAHNGMLKLQDAIATTLSAVSSDTLKSFLSPTVNTFKAIFGKKDMQLVIWRKGLEVFVGTYEHHTGLRVFGFEHVAGFLIGYDGSWHLKVTAGNAYSNPKWPDVWAGKFDSYGGLAKMVVEVEEREMEKRAGTLAEGILREEYWTRKVDVKMT